MSRQLGMYIEAISWLAQRPYVTIEEFATHFGITKRKAKEVLATLTYVGPDQGGGGLVDISYDEDIVVRDAQGLDRPIRFNRLEAFALLSGLAYLKTISPQDAADKIESLIAKIEDAIGFSVDAIDVIGNRVNGEIVEILRQAILDNGCVEIEYTSGTGDVTLRVIEPHLLQTVNDVVYVASWCQQANETRTFRLDRIMSAKVSSNSSTNHAKVQAQVDEALGTFVALVATPEALEVFREPNFVSQDILPNGRVQAVLQVGSLDWLAGQVVASAGQIEVLEPTELRSEVQKRTGKWLETHTC